jgi:hypothetical protein
MCHNFYLFIFLLASCSNKNSNDLSFIESNQTSNINILQNKEWYEYVDSIKTVKQVNGKCIDSISIYFMNQKAPEILSRDKYIIWKKNGEDKHGDFIFFTFFGDTLLQFVDYRKSNVSVSSYHLTKNELSEPRQIIVFELNQSEYKGSCYEITNLKKYITNQKIEIEIPNACSDKIYYKKINIR